MSRTIGGFEDDRLYGADALDRCTYGAALLDLAAQDPRIVCLGADLSRTTQTHLFRDRHPDRFFMIGMQEANMVGVAGGMARMGDIPFAHSFCVFITRRVYDQIAMQAAYPALPVKLVGFCPGLTTPLGVSHQAIDDVALMRALPNMSVIEPSGPEQVRAAVAAAHACPGPVYLRLPLQTGPIDPAIAERPLEFGRGEVLREGGDVAILASGITVAEAARAADALERSGISVTLANVHTLKPFDSDLAVALARRHRAMLTVENHSVIGGLASATVEALAASDAHVRFHALGVRDVFAEGASTPYLLAKHGLDARHVEAAARDLLG